MTEILKLKGTVERVILFRLKNIFYPLLIYFCTWMFSQTY